MIIDLSTPDSIVSTVLGVVLSYWLVGFGLGLAAAILKNVLKGEN